MTIPSCPCWDVIVSADCPIHDPLMMQDDPVVRKAIEDESAILGVRITVEVLP